MRNHIYFLTWAFYRTIIIANCALWNSIVSMGVMSPIWLRHSTNNWTCINHLHIISYLSLRYAYVYSSYCTRYFWAFWCWKYTTYWFLIHINNMIFVIRCLRNLSRSIIISSSGRFLRSIRLSLIWGISQRWLRLWLCWLGLRLWSSLA